MTGWQDDALVLRTRRHGENHAIALLFGREVGAASGLVHGGQGARKAPILQPGNEVQASWRGRGDQLGNFTLELRRPFAANGLAARTGLLALSWITEILAEVLPEGTGYPPLYDATLAVLSHLEDEAILAVLLAKWELGLLRTLGYGLSLEACAITGQSLEDGAALTHVSPKTGAAVTYEAGEPWRDRLLPLPSFLIDRGEPERRDIVAAFTLTGYFLEDRLLAPAGKTLPQARAQFAERLRRG